MGPSRKAQPHLTRLELRIMQVLWENGASTVQAVQEKLPGEALAYTTVQTMLNVLQRKGRVKRKLVGKAFEYRPVLSRDRALRDAAVDLVDRVFGGSVDALLMSLVKNRQLDGSKLAKLKQLIDEHEESEEGGHGDN
ncbi:MAG TPA: BlaI/MecI/CopY family transcriptional regulator [Candidatus Dormibacteraeota bacterium]|nr:BlaI/MecI/CopY family transcriptional regulator [Candidatus Dormibacteraeota bacterium]